MHYTAGDQGVKIGIADAHIRSGFENLPERANVLFEIPIRLQLLCGGFHELLQCRELLIHLVLHRMDDQLKLRINIVWLQFQRLTKIFDALLFGCSLLRKIQIIVGGLRRSVFIDRADAMLRQELLCQTIHTVFIRRLIPMLHQETLKLFQKLFCISAHFYLPYLLRGLLIVWFSCMKLYQIRQPSSRDKRHLII